jgi:hypothetical protein
MILYWWKSWSSVFKHSLHNLKPEGTSDLEHLSKIIVVFRRIIVNVLAHEWLSDCCLIPTRQFFSYIIGRTSKFSMRWWWGPLCTRPTCLVRFFIVLAHWNNSSRIDMSLHWKTLSWFRANQSLLILLNVACNTYQFCSLWFDLIWTWTHDLPHLRWAC